MPYIKHVNAWFDNTNICTYTYIYSNLSFKIFLSQLVLNRESVATSLSLPVIIIKIAYPIMLPDNKFMQVEIKNHCNYQIININ